MNFKPDFTDIEAGNLKIKHHSTCSCIQITLEGRNYNSDEEMWLDYDELDLLIVALDSIKKEKKD